jgi:hypothetical protein
MAEVDQDDLERRKDRVGEQHSQNSEQSAH